MKQREKNYQLYGFCYENSLMKILCKYVFSEYPSMGWIFFFSHDKT